MATKIGRGDYILDVYPCPKFHYDQIGGFCPPPTYELKSPTDRWMTPSNVSNIRPGTQLALGTKLQSALRGKNY